MIRINLLAGSHAEQPKKKGFSPRLFLVALLVLIAAGVAVFLSMRGFPAKSVPAPAAIAVEPVDAKDHQEEEEANANTSHQESTPALPATETLEKPAITPVKPDSPAHAETVVNEPAAPVQTDSEKTAFAPSSHKNQEAVEEVVGQQGAKDDLVSLAYNEMSLGEKINFEIAFAKKTSELLIAAVPVDIEFSSLVIDSFSIIKATGIGPSRESVSRLFNSLRERKFVFRERPASTIRPIGRQGFKFDFVCEIDMGLDTGSEYNAVSSLPLRNNFTRVFNAFNRVAAASGIELGQDGLVRVAAENTGGYRRYTYHMAGKATFRDFVKLVFEAYKQHLPCSFTAVTLKARNDYRVAIEADVVFTFVN